ncbi:MAG: hypothetical protein WAN31_01820 [Methylovirgula sp.]
MRPQPILLKLGAEEWRLRPLTLAQVQRIEPLLAADSKGGTIAAAIEIVAIALSRDHPEAAQKLSDVEATAKEIGVAMADVLRLGGFIAAENAPGEAMAGSTSISSTPA